MQDNDTSLTSGRLHPSDFATSSRFSQHEELPSKGYCRIFKAQRYGKWYVLKGLKPAHVADPLYVAMLEKEFSTAVTLDHSNIVHTYSLETDAVVGRCIVMEYIDGRTLSQFLEERTSLSKRKKVALQLLDAMQYYHAKQITHRDLKPSNILITSNGDNVKLIDFGLADTDDYAVLKEPAYTKAYAAPEQLKQGQPVDCRTDIYAFGVLLRQLFPHRYLVVRHRCTRYQPSSRYPSASAVRVALKRSDTVRLILPIIIAVLIAVATALLLLPGRQQTGSVPDISNQAAEDTSLVQDDMGSQQEPIAPEPQNPTITPKTSSSSSDGQLTADKAKAVLQKYADSLYVEWKSNVDNGTYDYYDKALESGSYLENRILERLYPLIDELSPMTAEEWYASRNALWPPMRDFHHKTTEYLTGKALPHLENKYSNPEYKKMMDSSSASAKRVLALMEASRQNAWKRSQ